MADEQTSRQGDEQEALDSAETESAAPSESLTVEITELTDDDAQADDPAAPADADTNAENDAADEKPAENDAAEKEMPLPEQPASASKADALKEKAAGVAGLLKDKAGQLSDSIRQAGEKKKKENTKKKTKQKAPKRTVEEELADLAEEEKQFDEWGRKIRKKRKFTKRKKSRKLSCTLVLLTVILASSSVLAAAILGVAKEMYGIDKDIGERIVTISDGSTTQDIAEQLQLSGMISLPQVFRLVSRMNGKDGSYIAGEHVIRPSMSYEAMIEELCTNKADERETQRIVIPEGTKLIDVARILQENEICNAEDFLFYFNGGNYGFRFEEYLPEKSAQKWQQREGYCFPDTYDFYVKEEPNIVAQKIYANFDSKMTDGDYQKMEELGMTLDQVITLASMVQGEASRVDYMKHISAIFHNRLQSPALFPKLESDPTRKYADVIAENLLVPDDIMTTAYNTYKGTGLPPGAINNPGREAIEAVLYPLVPCNDYFFNSNIDTGETFFAETNDQHEQNLAIVQAQYAAAKAAANGET